MAMQRSTVVGVFDDRQRAQECVEALHNAGFTDQQIGYAMRGENAPQGTTDTGAGNHAGTGAGAGLLTGGAIGAAAGAVLTGLIPGVGPFIAGGILAGVIGGAIAGGAAGGLLGALTGMGVPRDEAEYYNREFESGHVVVTVQAANRWQEANDIVRRFGGRMSGMDTTTTAGTATGPTVQLREEQLQARKTTTQAGEVEIGKRVVTEQQSMDVPVTHEEVEITRRPVDKPASGTIDETARETLRVPLTEERVEVDKKPVVTEEVSVNKRPVTETQHVTETVRHEEADIHRTDSTTAGVGGSPHEHRYVQDRCAICGAPRSEHPA